MIFKKVKPEFLEAFLVEDAFFSAISMIFNNVTDLSIISRGASITFLMLQKFPQKSDDFCGIIFQFLPYCFEFGVLDLFVEICKPGSSMENVQKSFVEAKFAKILINIIRECDPNNYELLTNLLIIVRNAAENNVLKKIFRTKEMLNTLRNLLENESINVLNELWRSIYVLTCLALLKECNMFVDKAILNVSEVYNNVNAYRVFSLDFLAKLLIYQDETFKFILELQIQQVILRLIVQFPDSSNLMGAIFRLIEYSIRWPLFTKVMVNHFVPLMITEASNNQKNAVIANCYSTINKLNQLRQNNQLLDKVLSENDMFDSFVNQKLKKYNNILDKSYGGEMDNIITRYHSNLFLT